MSGGKKVVHLTSFHTPGDTRLFHRELKTLVRAGYEVVLVAAWNHDDLIDGIRIRAVPPSRTRLERLRRTVWGIYRAALEERADLYHFHDPELLPVGLLLRLSGKRVIYDAHEDLPRQIRTWFFIPPVVRGLTALSAAAVERIAGRILNSIVAATPTIAARFPPSKTVLVHNFPILAELTPAAALPYADRPPLAAYVGGISEIRGIRHMVEAMGLLPESLGARLVVAGAYFVPLELGDAVRAMPGWTRCSHLGWQDRPGVARVLGEARIGMVVVHPTTNHIAAYPLKLFEYMAAGIPVVASDFPIWRGIVDEAGCGLLVDPLDSKAIAGAIEWLLTHPAEAEAMGRRGRRAVETRFNWESEAKKLLGLYEKLLGK
jgi:glycosyltransferase involved in cell wall biosynthesis